MQEREAAEERAPRVYGWPPPPRAGEAPALVLADLDGTLRGDVLPMVKLVGPLLPRFADKVLRREPWNARKLAHFLWDVLKLWTLRTLHAEERRRYKQLFSELHHLAAAMLRGAALDAVRAKYDAALPRIPGLWHAGAVELVARMTARALVALVTGSEQLQTEACVARLAPRVDPARVRVHGSLYRHDPRARCFTGGAEHLNVTLDGKRDVVRHVLGEGAPRVVAAFGNSRPDRALFEAVEPGGLRVLVCSERVFARRRASGFVPRKLARAGFRVCWSGAEYLEALEAPGAPTPVLATDASFASVLDCAALRARYPELLAPLAAPLRAPEAPARPALRAALS